MVAREAEALRLFVPMDEQERFFSSEANERIALGGNRGGKTTVTCMEIARAVTGQDPHDKYPKTDGRCILVGKDLTHCSKVFYAKLFKPGAYRVIRDVVTKKWRPFLPNDPDDAARQHLSKPAPPLIPKRFYEFKKIAWENKKDEIPKTIPLKNGWTIHFFSSLGAPPQGWNVDLVAFDEEIEHPLWYVEMSARLLDNMTVCPTTGKVRGGKFIWSATPQSGTQHLYDLKGRAEECRDDDAPPIEMFSFGLLDNSFLSTKSKDDFVEKLKDNEDEYNVRVLGNFALIGSRVYPEFAPKGAHGMKAFEIPREWTRYAFIDPGRQVCAVLFVAVPPPHHEYGGRVFLYDELYVKKCNAKIFASRMREKVGDQSFHRFYIDHHAGRITEIGSGKTHEQQYKEALQALKVECETTKSGFTWASDDVRGGIEAVRNGLHLDDVGRAKWVVFWERCKNFCWEAERYSYRRDAKTRLITDDPVKLNDHLMDNWRYCAMARLRYVRPVPKKRKGGYTAEILKQKKERQRRRDGHGGGIYLG